MMTKCNYGECCFHCSGSLPGYEDVAGACDPCGCKAKMRDLAEVASTAMAGCNARDEVIARMEAEVARLKHRLEVDVVYRPGPGMRLVAEPAPEGIPDGIDCRDETIKGLEAEVVRLRLAMKNALAAAAHWRNRAMENEHVETRGDA